MTSDLSQDALVKLMKEVHAHAAPSEDLACISVTIHETFPDTAVVAYQRDDPVPITPRARRVVGAVYENQPEGEWFLKVSVIIGSRDRHRAIGRIILVIYSIVGHRYLGH